MSDEDSSQGIGTQQTETKITTETNKNVSFDSSQEMLDEGSFRSSQSIDVVGDSDKENIQQGYYNIFFYLFFNCFSFFSFFLFVLPFF